MRSSLKISFYILLFGLLTFFAATFGTTQKQQYSPADVLGESTGLQLFVQPGAGHTPIIDVINSAQSEILVEVYLFSDKETITALEQAKVRGISVKVMLEQHPFGGSGSNQNVSTELSSVGIQTQWTNPAFALTHEKVIIIDGKAVCILNQNLTTAAFTKNREYDVCDENSEDVSEAKNIFNSDWERKSFSPVAANLVVSPDNSRGKLTALINSAQKSLDLEIEVLEDDKIVGLLAEKAKTIPVRIIIPPKRSISLNRTVEGAQMKTLNSPYIHAKLLIADGERAYVGSINLSSQSLDKNRELGIIISQPDLVESLNKSFRADFESAATP